MAKYSVYIIACSDGTLYTGVTTDLSRRLREHNLGRGAKYTRGRTPVKLIYQEVGYSRSAALKREHEIKKKPKKAKLKMV